MRYFLILFLQVLVFLPLYSDASENTKPHAQAEAPKPLTQAKVKPARALGNLPLYFIKNTGQLDGRVIYYEKGARHATYFTQEGLVLSLSRGPGKTNPESADQIKTEALRLSFVGGKKDSAVTAGKKMPGRVNYFVGNDRSRWRTNVPTFGEVTYKNVYENIDIRFYGTGRNIEHDVIVRPGGDPSLVRLAYKGIKGLELTPGGDLRVRLEEGEIIEKRPLVYQEIKGTRKIIESGYRIIENKDGRFVYGFDLASYDRTRELVIDPVLVYSTYLGGSEDDSGADIAVDTAGNIYVTGNTKSPDFPVKNPIQGTIGGGGSFWEDVFVTKTDPSGSTLIYSTYLGGFLGDFGNAITVDATGNAYITGTSSSPDFPLVSPIQGTKGIFEDAFVVKLNASGSAIIYSTFLGGNYSDFGRDIAIDASGAAYITGKTGSSDFPLVNPIAGGLPPGGPYPPDAFVAKINPAGTALVYSTYLGGSSFDEGKGIAVDTTGAAYITGSTSSSDYPAVAAMQLSTGGWDAFISKIDPSGTALVYSTYLGGTSIERGEDIAADSSGAAYVTGETSSSDFPLVSPIEGYHTGTGYDDVFIAKVNPSGSALVYSTCLGGSSPDHVNAIAIDSAGNAYVTGYTWSTDFTVVNPVQGVYGGGYSDAFVAMVDASGSSFTYSTYLGGGDQEEGMGIAADNAGNTYVTGWTKSQDFPLESPLQGVKNGGVFTSDAFVSKIDGTPPPPVIMYLNPGSTNVTRGSTLLYSVTATNTTPMKQCFQYWEDLTLPGSMQYPTEGELYGPLKVCLAPGATKTTQLSHGVPVTAQLGTYTLNAYVGAYGTPAHHLIVDRDQFNFIVTTYGPVTRTPNTSWSVLGNGFETK